MTIAGTVKKILLCIFLVFLLVPAGCKSGAETEEKKVAIGSKHFTEQEVLGEIMAQGKTVTELLIANGTKLPYILDVSGAVGKVNSYIDNVSNYYNVENRPYIRQCMICGKIVKNNVRCYH